jgi:DNA-binding XRE family transcriptional regulator
MNGIRHFRLKAGLTQQQVADSVGVRQTSVSAWEHNNAEPKPQTLRALASLFLCSIEDIMMDYDEGGE